MGGGYQQTIGSGDPWCWPDRVVYSQVLSNTSKDEDLGQWALETGSKKSSLRIYDGVRRGVRLSLLPYLRVQSQGQETLNTEGPAIYAPVHRSHLDSVVVAALSERRVRALAKESLFTAPGLGRLCATMGAIPVRRGEADLAAMKSAKRLLDTGVAMIVFPEGTRQTSTGGPDQIGELFDGTAWLAARTGAQVIPIGVAGTGQAMGEGSKWIRRSRVAVVVGDALPAPTGPDGKRANRTQMAEFTDLLRSELQQAQDTAVNLSRS